MLPVLPDVTIDLIKASTLTKLHADIVRLRGWKASTANRYLEIISAVLNYAFKRDEITHVPAIPYVAERKKAVEFLTQEEANRLLGQLPEHLARMAKFALATGLREANVRLLEWRQVDLKRHVAWVRGEDAKEEKSITVPAQRRRDEGPSGGRGGRSDSRVHVSGTPARLQSQQHGVSGGARAGGPPEAALARPAAYLGELAPAE